MLEGRLIDSNWVAEKLKSYIRDDSMKNLNSKEILAIVIDLVKHDAPTIDAVPMVHGHWLKATGMMPPEWFGKHVCSVCDHFAPNDEYRGIHEMLSPICPHCGAYMDMEKNGGGSNGE